MKNLSILLPVLLTATVSAQGPTITTTTDFGVLANDGSTVDFDAEANGTTVGRGLGVRASVGGGRRSPADAYAGSSISPTRVSRRSSTRGVSIREFGGVNSDDANASYAAGTSADAPNTQAPTQGAHSASVAYGVAQGTTGTVSIRWEARASSGANLTASIDVDGDGTADWTGSANNSDAQQIPVTAGANGVVIDITTDGSASVSGEGRERYYGSLSVSFSEGGGGGGFSCTWTSNGPQCSGSLTGTDSLGNRSLGLTLDVAGAEANGIGVMVIGDPAQNPIPLPGNCQLLVEPVARSLDAFVTDANGDAQLNYRIAARALDINFQALTLGLANNGKVGTTNALNLVCQ